MINGYEIGLKDLMRIDIGLIFIMFYWCIRKVPHPHLEVNVPVLVWVGSPSCFMLGGGS